MSMDKIILVFLTINIMLQIWNLNVDSKRARLKSVDIEPWVTELKAWAPQIKIKYFSPEVKRLGYIEGQKSNWIDLRCAEDIKLKAGEFKLIPLGVAMELPEGYEAYVVPRSSTFKNWGILQTNSMGIIDHSFKGDTDQWFMPVYATRDTEIKLNDRICQFRIQPTMGEVELMEVSTLSNPSRGGHGTTGIN